MGVQPISVPQSLAYVLTAAGDRNGVDFDYLLQTAMRESSLNPQAKAQTSSAVGLFQFLEGTWLQVMKEEGPRLGYGDIASHIERSADGDYFVRDAATKAEILKLREDPQIAADLAAAFTKSNGDYLSQRFGRMPSAGELYIAHFLGAQGAERMFTAGLQDPDQIYFAPDIPQGSGRGSWVFGPWFTPALTLMVGTTESMRNVVGERVLGLPRDRDPSSKGDWSQQLQVRPPARVA